MGHVEELFEARSTKEFFLNIQSVKSPKGDRDLIVLLGVDWKGPGEIKSGDCDDTALRCRNSNISIDGIDRSGASEDWSTKSVFDFRFGGPVLPAPHLFQINVELRFELTVPLGVA